MPTRPSRGRAAAERTSFPGKSYFDLLSEEGGDGRLRKKVEAAVERAGSWNGRLTRKSEGGQVRELDVTVSPIRGRTGAITITWPWSAT